MPETQQIRSEKVEKGNEFDASNIGAQNEHLSPPKRDG